MKHIYSTIVLFSFVFSYSQSYTNIKILDSESNKPIPQAKVISNNEIFYTNDDGNVLIPSQIKDVVVSAISYDAINSKLPVSEIKLSLIYKNIEEVEIKSINAKSIIEKVLYYYDKNYLVKPTLYSGTYKERSYIDNKIHKLLVADINLWTLNNKFDYKKENMDSFVQMNLNNVKYYKTRRDEANYPFSQKEEKDKNDIKSFAQRFFLYNQLYIMNYYTRDLRINGKILNETDGVQEISFKSDFNKKEAIGFDGTIIYNVKENAIIYMKVHQTQPSYSKEIMNNFDEKIKLATTDFFVSYDFVKEDGKYIPSKIEMDYIADINYRNQNFPAISSKQFVFRTHKQSNNKGIVNKIDLSKNLIDNVPTKEVKESKILLSTEEQKFIDEH